MEHFITLPPNWNTLAPSNLESFLNWNEHWHFLFCPLYHRHHHTIRIRQKSFKPVTYFPSQFGHFVHFLGNVLYDFVIGREPNLRVGSMDVKLQLLHVCLVIWAVLVATMTAEVYVAKGSLPAALILASLSQLIYVGDFMLFEVCVILYFDNFLPLSPTDWRGIQIAIDRGQSSRIWKLVLWLVRE